MEARERIDKSKNEVILFVGYILKERGEDRYLYQSNRAWVPKMSRRAAGFCVVVAN